MGFQDRHYQQVGSGGQYNGGGPYKMGSGIGLPVPTQGVKYLLILNVIVYVIQLVSKNEVFLWFAAKDDHPFQIWRYVTFQFLHGNFSHILFNLLFLYFFGPLLERLWGTRTFIKFYLICGAVGGIIFTIVSNMSSAFSGTLVGASGGLMGIMASSTLLFPKMRVLVWGMLPVPIVFLTLIYLVSYIANVFNVGSNAGGDICHLGGMAVGALWVWGSPFFESQKAKYEQATVQRDRQVGEKQQYDVDRILAKVHEKGVHSLTSREKQTLQHATDQEKEKPRR